MSDLVPRYTTIVDSLLARSDTTDTGVRFIRRSGNPVFHSYQEVLERAVSVAGNLQARGLEPGERVGIVLPTCIEFLDVFLGVQLAGAIPAALYPPVRLGRLDEYYHRTRHLLTDIGARFLITDNRVGKLLGPVLRGSECLEEVLKTGDLSGNYRRIPVDVAPEDPAFLQFSSGTTGMPKAVVISNANLMANLEMMGAVFRDAVPDEMRREGVCWLPLYHDMGLVGCLFNGIYLPTTISYIEPERFIVNPALWLQTISRYRAWASPAPQFAYNLCVNKIKDKELDGVDLSSWAIALNGAEPIDIAGLDQFARRFSKWGFPNSAMTPVYGLSEATLAVTFSDARVPPRIVSFDRSRLDRDGRAVPGEGISLVSVGRPLAGCAVDVRDGGNNALPEACVGRIRIRGASISSGYFNTPDVSEESDGNGWFDTGDLGFIFEGDLFVYGRTKELIIIRGRNIAPQDVESTLNGLPGVRPGAVVAVGTPVEGLGEQLIVLAETDVRHPRPEDELVEAIHARVLKGTTVKPYHVQLLEPGTIPRTSSGKKKRLETLDLYLSGKLVPPEKMGPIKLLIRIGQSMGAWRQFNRQRRREGEKWTVP